MDLLNKINRFAKGVGDKTGDVIELGKLKTKIISENGRISELKEKLGGCCFDLFCKGETSLSVEAQELCAQIQAACDTVASLEAQIQGLKAEQTSASAAAASEPVQEEAAAPKFCAACGNQISNDAKFCSSCGYAVAVPVAPAEAAAEEPTIHAAAETAAEAVENLIDQAADKIGEVAEAIGEKLE